MKKIKPRIVNPQDIFLKGNDTSFRFELVGGNLISDKVEEINNIEGKSKIKKRVKAIISFSSMLDFKQIENKTFLNNLTLIDTFLPKILSVMVLQFHLGSLSKTSDLLTCLEEGNILDFDTSENHPYYSYKVKRLYMDIALGMMPAKVWDGNYNATGGYLTVKSDGDIVCYNAYEKNQFESYLINNTEFETASSSRYDFGKIYTENGKLYMNLNLQIRFIK